MQWQNPVLLNAKIERMRAPLLSIVVLVIAACATPAGKEAPDTVTISVVGTNDVHGEFLPQPDRGGILTFSGYVAALREARRDDGAVLLVDAGDMWQGTLESNLAEGAVVVEAYNALGYDAAAIGNHEFDFGPAGPKSIPVNSDDDPRGALKLRATEARFPLLNANILHKSTGQRVAWDNVRPSTMITKAGIDIGLIGVVTVMTPATTIPANVSDLEIGPLADAITIEARRLRREGADLVVVLAHAGGRCTEFDDPTDLSSCQTDAEIMRVARDIPDGLVDHIVAGHHHNGMAHIVNGIAVTSSYSNARAFSRVDFTLDASSGDVLARKIFPPQTNEPRASYEGHALEPFAPVVPVAARAQQAAERQRSRPLGVYLETPMTHRPGPESELGNLLVDAVREAAGADISIHNVRGGIRAELPAGELTFGSVFRMFPFDNRVAVIDLSGAELRSIVAAQVHNVGRRAGFSGMRVHIDCADGRMSVRLVLPGGDEIADHEIYRVAVNDFLLLGGDNVLTPAIPEDGFTVPHDTPLVRDLLVEWFSQRGGRLHTDDFLDTQNRRWNLPGTLPAGCVYEQN